MLPDQQFSALADPTRCRIVEMLSSESLPVHRLAQEFEISRPAVSRHLRVLKDAGLVREEKEGRENVYSLEAHRLRALNSWIGRFWSQRLSAFKGMAEAGDRQGQLELNL